MLGKLQEVVGEIIKQAEQTNRKACKMAEKVKQGPEECKNVAQVEAPPEDPGVQEPL